MPMTRSALSLRYGSRVGVLASLVILCLSGATPARALNLVLTDQTDTPIGTPISAELLARTLDSVSITIIGENTPWSGNNWVGWTNPGLRDQNTILRPSLGNGTTGKAVTSTQFGLFLLNDVNLGAGSVDSVYTVPDDSHLFTEHALSLPDPPNGSQIWFVMYDVRGLGFRNYRWYDGDGEANDFSGDYDILVFVDDDHTSPNFDYDDFMGGIVGARPKTPCDDNLPPTVDLGSDTSIFQCAFGPICIYYTVSDPNGLAGLIEQLIDGPTGATIDTLANRICFVTPCPPYDTIIVRVTDTCGGVDYDTIQLHVTVNSPPTIAFGPDQNITQCTPGPICAPYTVADPDGYSHLIETLVSGPAGAALDTAANQVCFTPAGPGTYTIIAKVTDSCGAYDVDTIVYNVSLDSPPTIAFGPDQAVTQCALTQVCAPYTVADPDGFTGLVESLVSGPGGATIDTALNQVCFTPSGSGIYTVIAKVADPCDAFDLDTIVYTITVNGPPTIAFGPDQSFTQCTPTQICAPYSVSDPNGLALLVESLVSAPAGAVIDTALDQVCFTPSSSGSYTIIAQVMDSCGAYDLDTIVYDVTVNAPPTITFGPDQYLTQCTPAQICAPYTVSDPNGLAWLVETLISGPSGAVIDTATNQICFTPSGSGGYTIIAQVTDSCGAYDLDTIVYNVSVNAPPTIVFGPDQDLTQCVPAQICASYTVSDPNGPALLVETLVFGPTGATIDTALDQVCFTPAASGVFTIIAKVMDSCGAYDLDTTVYNVTVNAPPTIAFGDDQSLTQCTPEQICAPYTVSDPNGPAQLLETLISGPSGAVIDTALNQVCFTPSGSGTFTITGRVTDSCGAYDLDTIVYDVTVNAPPTIAFGDDQTLTQCTPEPICAPYTVSDPDGLAWLSEMLISGPTGAVIDTALNQVCFTPSGSGSYTIIARVMDSCGVSDLDTIVYNVTLDHPPTIAFGTDQTVAQCTPAQICAPYTVSDPDGLAGLVETLVSGPAGATIDTAANQVCFTPSGSGVYTIIARVADGCSDDLDTIVYTVTQGGPPTIAFGNDFTVFQCTPEQICVPYTVSDPDGLTGLIETLVSGPSGAVIDTANNRVCFTPTTSGTRTIIAKVTDPCNLTDYDTIKVTVLVNRPPFIQLPKDTSLFLCEPDTICFGPIIEFDLDGNGSYDATNIGWINYRHDRICFVPDTSGMYQVIVCLVDSCGAQDCDTMLVTVALNRPPVCQLPNDTTIFQCDPAPICLPAYATDPDGNLTGCQIVSGPGQLVDGQWCYTPTGDEVAVVTIRCTDACGAYCEKTFRVTIDINDPPVCDFPTLTPPVCTPPIYIVPFTSTDPEGDATSCVLYGPGTLNDHVYTYVPTGGETINVIIRCFDDCEDSCEINFSVTFPSKQPPTCNLPRDTTIRLCTPTSVCLPVSATSPNPPVVCSVAVGPGEVAGGNWCFTPADDDTADVTIRCTDICGATCEGSFRVIIVMNDPPTVDLGPDQNTFVCSPEPICVPYTVSDLDGLEKLVEMLVSGPPGATIDTAGNRVCFTPSGAGTNTVIVRVVDTCSAEDYDTLVVNVTMGQPPVIDLGADRAPFLCALEPVCVPYTTTSFNPGATLFESLVSGPPGATIDTVANQICFTPAAAGSYTIIAHLLEMPCNTQDLDTVVVDVTLNGPPTISFGADENVAQCTPSPICAPYTISDPDGLGTLIETLVSGPTGATIDTAGNNVCFTPTGAGTYTIIARVADSCGASDLDTISYTVTVNDPPIIVFGNDQSVTACTGTPICASYTVDDPNGLAGLIETLVSGPTGATIDTAANKVCFTPAGNGTYTIIARVTDPCGLFDLDTIVYTVTMNRAPVIDFGIDQTVSQCNATIICAPYTVSDADGPAGLIESLVSGPAGASIDTANNRVCFTPATSGAYTIIARVTDPCGLFDLDTVVYTVHLNSPPTIAFGNDTTIFLCSSTRLCLPYTVSDPDGFTGLIEALVSGPTGTSIDTAQNKVCFTPPNPGVYTLIAKVTDPCGLVDYDTIVVTTGANDPPVCHLPNDTTISQCVATQVCLPAFATDANGNLVSCQITSGPGLLQNGNWCFTPTGDETVNVTVRCTDACDAYCESSFRVTFIVNEPPVCHLPRDTTILQLCEPQTISLPASATDPDGNLTGCVVTDGAGQIIGGQWVYTPTHDTTVCVTVRCTDDCGAFCEATFCVTVQIIHEDCNCPIVVSVNHGVNIGALNGQTVSVPVHIDKLDENIGGFDLFLCYDQTAISLVTVTKGTAITSWEYFTYRLTAHGDCGVGCPTGLVHLIAIADLDNGTPHPPAEEFKPIGAVATIDFRVTSDRNFIGHCIPIRFCWLDCTDNTISSKSGDTTWLALDIVSLLPGEDCLTSGPGKPTAIPAICFNDGAICIQQPPDDRGDLNLNGIANEIGDAVLYTNFFIYGDQVWNPVWREIQILASDVNDDGLVLTIADLVYLIRIITGDVEPYPPNPKLSPYVGSATIVSESHDGELEIGWQSPVAVGGAHFVIQVPSNGRVGKPVLTTAAADMEIKSYRDGNELRVLVYSTTGASIAAGDHQILSIPITNADGAELASSDLATADGAVLPAAMAKSSALPSSFTVVQNYPNPFNAGTVIRFGMSERGEYDVSVYDITGRRVWRASGEGVGWVNVPWDGRNEDGDALASGIYLYRVQTAQGAQTRKMTLLK
ncbi:MAG: T9SS type A sorting domain-containing protein [Candidatus Zixiibacteriota bacterium]